MNTSKTLLPLIFASLLLVGCRNKPSNQGGNTPGGDVSNTQQSGGETSGGGSGSQRTAIVLTNGATWGSEFDGGYNFSYKDPREKLEKYFNRESGVSDFTKQWDCNNVFSQFRDSEDDRVLTLNSGSSAADWLLAFNYRIVSVECEVQAYYKVSSGKAPDQDVSFTIGTEDDKETVSFENEAECPTTKKVITHTFATPVDSFNIVGLKADKGRTFFNYLKFVYLA